MLSVRPLYRCATLMPTVSDWLLCEWPSWYGKDGPGDHAADVAAFAQSESSLPVGFVVFAANEPVGFGALKQESIPSHKHLSPWAATGFVLPQYRRQGVGAFILQAIVAHARGMGYQQVYCGTSTAMSLLQRAGWRHMEQVVHAGKPLGIFSSGA